VSATGETAGSSAQQQSLGHANPGAVRRALSLAVDAVCPLVLIAILVDCTRRVGWAWYERDPSIYASIARYWEDGLIPYRDVWEFKPPLIFVALRTGFALWGYEAESLRRVLLILTTAGALSLYFGLRRARCLIAAPVAALGLMTLVVVNPWGLPLQNTESLVVAFGALAIGCAAAHQRAPRWWWALLSGACPGLATTGKQPAAIFALPLGFQLCLWGAPAGWRARVVYGVQRALLGMIGFVLVVAAFALYFASHNALAAFYDAVLVDGVRYSGAFSLAWFHPTTLDPSLSQRIPVSLARFLSVRPQWPFIDAGHMWPFVGAIVVLPVLTLLRPSRWVATIWMWLFAALLAVLVGPAGENHYLVMTLPAVALTVGIACELIWPDVIRRGVRARRCACSAALRSLRFSMARRGGRAMPRSAARLPGPTWSKSRRASSVSRSALPRNRATGSSSKTNRCRSICMRACRQPRASSIGTRQTPPPSPSAARPTSANPPSFSRTPASSAWKRGAPTSAAPDAIDRDYERWLTSPVGVVYRRGPTD
jgi:hypothetical protein